MYIKTQVIFIVFRAICELLMAFMADKTDCAWTILTEHCWETGIKNKTQRTTLWLKAATHGNRAMQKNKKKRFSAKCNPKLIRIYNR